MAQPGSTCQNPIYLGHFSDTVLQITVSFPDSIQWYSFSSPVSKHNLALLSVPTAGQNPKMKAIYIRNTQCQNLYTAGPKAYPGFLHRAWSQPKNPNDTLVIGIVRHYDSSCGSCDSVAESFTLHINSQNVNRNSCNSTLDPCNLVLNGDFDNDILTGGNSPFPFSDYMCEWELGLSEFPYYFRPDFSAVNINTSYNSVAPILGGFALCNTCPPPAVYNTHDPAGGGSFVGCQVDGSQSHIFSQTLPNPLSTGRQYFLSALVAPDPDLAIIECAQLDISNQAYDPANYPTGNTADIHVNSYSPGNSAATFEWTEVYTVITAGTNDQYLHIGNLSLSNPTQNDVITFYDRIQLIPFDFELGSPAPCFVGDIGPECTVPGATYTWTDQNNQIVHNQAIWNINSSIPAGIYTLTVSLSPSVWNPGGPGFSFSDQVVIQQGISNVSLNANPVYFSMNNAGNAPLPILSAGGANGTSYTFSVQGGPILALNSPSSQYQLQNSDLPSGPYPATVTYEVTVSDSNGCSGSATVDIVFVESCSDLDNFAQVWPGNGTTLNAGIGNGSNVSSQIFFVQNNFNINTQVNFSSCVFLIEEGARLRVSAHSNFENCTFRDACDFMWNTVELASNVHGTFKDCQFTQAEIAISLRANSGADFFNNDFYDNVIGIGTIAVANQLNAYDIGAFSGNHFRGTGTYNGPIHTNNGGVFLPRYNNQPFLREVPAMGVFISSSSYTELGANVEADNRFENMYQGIVYHNSSGFIKGCLFRDIYRVHTNPNHPPLGTPPSIRYETAGAALGARNFSNVYMASALTQDGFNHPSIRNCYRGIHGISSDVHATGIYMDSDQNAAFNWGGNQPYESLWEGVRIRLPQYQTTIQQCHIRAKRKGIYFDDYIPSTNTTNGLLHRIVNNEIEIVNFQNHPNTNAFPDPFSEGISVDQANSFGMPCTQAGLCVNQGCEIANNRIYTTNARYGIRLENAQQTLVRQNFISVRPRPNWSSNRGISCEGGSLVHIQENNILGDNSSLSSNNTSNTMAILVDASGDPMVECNLMDETRNGLVLQGALGGNTIIRTNSANDHYVNVNNNMGSFGLRIEASAAFNEQIGEGNIFTSRFSNPTSPIISSANPTIKFKTEEVNNGVPLCPREGNFGNVWFLPLSANATNSCSFDPNVISPDFNPYLFSLFGEVPIAPIFDPDLKLQAKLHLVRNLTEMSIQGDQNLNGLVEDFKEAPSGKLSILEQETSQAWSAFQNCAPCHEIKYEMDSLIKLYIQSRNPQIIAQIRILSESLNNLMMHSAQIDSQHQNSLQALSQIPTLTLIDQNRKAMLSMLLQVYQSDGNSSFAGFQNELEAIAFQCPVEGGSSVFQARAILHSYLNLDYTYNDEANCQNVWTQRMAQQSEGPNHIPGLSNEAPVQSRTKLFPNPGKNTLMIESAEELKLIRIIAPDGRLIQENPINSEKKVMDTSHLPSGVYFIQVFHASGQLSQHKWVKE